MKAAAEAVGWREPSVGEHSASLEAAARAGVERAERQM